MKYTVFLGLSVLVLTGCGDNMNRDICHGMNVHEQLAHGNMGNVDAVNCDDYMRLQSRNIN